MLWVQQHKVNKNYLEFEIIIFFKAECLQTAHGQGIERIVLAVQQPRGKLQMFNQDTLYKIQEQDHKVTGNETP